MKKRFWFPVPLAVLFVVASGCATPRPFSTREFPREDMVAEKSPAVEDQPTDKQKDKGILHEIVWYVPNRVLDFTDMFRFRVRAGLGLAANVRITKYADVYAGQYNAVYAGLPGPRMGKELGWVVGREQEKGLKLLGVDATDDFVHEANYSPTEFDAGIHLVVLGLEIGFDPVELGDFIVGLFLIDVREDDW